MKTKEETHTPGPWFRSTIQGSDCLMIGADDGSDIVADMRIDRPMENANADARLIAAAPDMLEALQGVIHHNDALAKRHKISPSLIGHIKRAIAKASGKEEGRC